MSERNMKRIISYSGGLGSFMAAKMTADRYGADNCHLLFTDTKTEDEDLYRFIRQTSKALKVQLTSICDGRNIWEVFNDHKFMGNSRIDPCSKELKRNLARRFMDQFITPERGILVVGIGADEKHRMKAIEENWSPYKVEAPLVEKPTSKEQILDVLDDYGIDPPRLYELGFPHNNCGGFCVKTGQAQMALLLKTFPDRYKWHENEQEKLFGKIGSHGFIRRTVNGEVQYLSLRQFRELLEAGEKPDLYPQKGCGCFV